jgi:hypothetical protein
VWPRQTAALLRPNRRRAIGGRRHADRGWTNPIVWTVIWGRTAPTNAVVADLIGGSARPVARGIAGIRPRRAAAGQATMRRADPGRKRRRQRDARWPDTPALAVVMAIVEQRGQRGNDRDAADAHARGKPTQPTRKSPGAGDAASGQRVAGADRGRGPTAASTVLAQARRRWRRPAGLGGRGAVADGGLATRQPTGVGASPRRKARGPARPAAASAENRAFARRPLVVEPRNGRMRRYQGLSQTDRQHRQNHRARVRAVAGRVNRPRPQAAIDSSIGGRGTPSFHTILNVNYCLLPPVPSPQPPIPSLRAGTFVWQFKAHGTFTIDQTALNGCPTPAQPHVESTWFDAGNLVTFAKDASDQYDAAKVLAAFSVRLQHETDLDTLTVDLLQVMDETLQPAHANLWIRGPKRESYIEIEPQRVSQVAFRNAYRNDQRTLG